GSTDVWIDELEVGPVFDTPASKPAVKPELKNSIPASKPAASKHVEFNGSSLLVDGKRFTFRGIRLTDTPPEDLRNAGFNTLFVEYPFDPAQMKKLADLGFWIVPSIPVASDDARVVSTEKLPQVVQGFPELDSVLFWNLGTALAYEQTTLVSRSAQTILAADRSHAVGGDAWDGLGRYSASLNLVSMHRWPLMTSMELTQYKDWLETRSRLVNPGTFMWTWIQTHTPEWYTQLLYNKAADARFDEPIGPQPEQVRLLTYLAVGSGYRGIGYWSDRFLANSHQGRDRLLTVALLNQELEFIEPLLNTVDGAPQWIDTSDPNVKAAVLRTQKGILVLPIWLGGSAQFVPGQAATAKLKITVPQVPPSFSCWEVTPGEVRGMRAEHGSTGGMQITVPEFGLTTAIVFISDHALLQHFQELCWARKQQAAQFTYELAVAELDKVGKIETQLVQAGHKPPQDGPALMKDAYDRLKDAKNYWDNHQYSECYRESQRALRPARILMRAQWDAAVLELTTPVASPWAVSYYTLPKHWEFIKQVKGAQAGANMLSGGGFELVPGQAQEAWYPQESTLDEVEMKAERLALISYKPIDPKTGKPGTAVSNLAAKEGQQFLLLEIKPKSKDKIPKALERTYLAINSPTIKLPPGTLVRISGWMAVPEAVQASPDGALLFDSAGGEPLAVRLATPTNGWRNFVIYRYVPASGTINVTLALTGLGRVAFDDIRIEPMVPR
ncbi:MAG TPA: hypothetical protein VE988_29230, partial [Gemmataceae bacterium]|nr:hypothetical protein [Gemmataceae bacterium]